MDDLYYIQNRGYSGDCLKWWRVDGCGYTLDLNQAWKVSAEKAAEICRNRPTEDIPWRVAYVDPIAHRHVNSECLGSARPGIGL